MSWLQKSKPPRDYLSILPYSTTTASGGVGSLVAISTDRVRWPFPFSVFASGYLILFASLVQIVGVDTHVDTKSCFYYPQQSPALWKWSHGRPV